MTKLDRFYLQSDPEIIVKVNVPSKVTLWVPSIIDMENEDYECSRIYITINDEDKCRLWKGTPLMFEMFHEITLQADEAIWACTRDQALIGIKIESIQ
jgi:hypothetical protein